ncbi:MAG: hypothetical protein ACO1Q7_03440 [Gemmatimonas sp.]
MKFSLREISRFRAALAWMSCGMALKVMDSSPFLGFQLHWLPGVPLTAEERERLAAAIRLIDGANIASSRAVRRYCKRIILKTHSSISQANLEWSTILLVRSALLDRSAGLLAVLIVH